MQPGDFCLNVDAINNQTGPIEPGNQQRVTPEIQASTSQYDQTIKLTSFEDLRQVNDAQLLGKLMVQNDEEHAKNRKWTKIQRVPEVLQRNKDFKEYFRPMVLSVGPLHAADPILFKAELKLKLAARFVKQSGCTAEILFKEIKKNLQELRTSFDEGLVHYNARKYLLPLIKSPSESKAVHLLDLLRSVLIKDYPDDKVNKCRDLLESFCEWVSTFCFAWVTHLLDFAFSLLESFLDYILPCFAYNWYEQQSFRNVQELKAAGISLKPSGSGSLSDISFTARWFLRGRTIACGWFDCAQDAEPGRL